MIYIDMDGVIADFDQSIVNVFGEKYNDKIATTFWKEICVEAQVFRRMPAIPEGIEMVRRIARENAICFMTSTGGMPHHIDIAIQKLDWLHAHDLGGHPVAFCMNTVGKGQFASKNKHLIDDRQKVCDAWGNEGGTPHLFTRDRSVEIADFFCSPVEYILQLTATRDAVWVHASDGGTVGRFGKNGFEILSTMADQWDSHGGPITSNDWDMFRKTAMKLWHIDVPEDAFSSEFFKS